jgi:hypothetical protein
VRANVKTGSRIRRRNRCVPILVTPAPMFGTNPEAEAHRQHNRTRARAAAQASGYLLDLDTLWGTRATPNTYRREYDWGDQMHRNDDACAPERLRYAGRAPLERSGRQSRLHSRKTSRLRRRSTNCLHFSN